MLRKFRDWSISTKFSIMNAFVLLAIVGIVVLTFLAFHHINQSLKTVIGDDVTQVTDNARLGRELNRVFAESTLLFSTFITHPESLGRDGEALCSAIQQTLDDADALKEKGALKVPLQHFQEAFLSVLTQAKAVATALQDLELLHADCFQVLDEVDLLLTDRMLEGSAEEFSTIERLIAVVPEYRETLLRANLLLKEMLITYLSMAEVQKDHAGEIGEFLSAFQSNLMLLSNAGRDFETFGVRLDESILAYQEQVTAYHQILQAFQAQQRSLNASEEQVTAAMEMIDRHIAEASDKIQGDIDVTIKSSFRLILLVSVAVFVILVFAAFYMARSIRPLRYLADVANQLALGDFTCDIQPAKSNDEIGRLLSAMGNMLGQFREIVTKVQKVSEHIAVSSEEMSISATQMSQGATQQAAATEEASSSMEQLSANSRNNTENAQAAEKLASKSAQDSLEGEGAVHTAVKAITTIAKEVDVIQRIALQTHMLSLNATVEASKAQDYGKGFSVVAMEVRTLANQVTDAAEKIEGLMASGLDTANHAGGVLTKLVPSCQSTADLVLEISEASREQSAGIEQINQAIQQLDQVTQQNAAVAEAISSTAEMLANQAQNLKEMTAFFQLPEAPQVTAIEEEIAPEQLQQLLQTLRPLLTLVGDDEDASVKVLGKLLGMAKQTEPPIPVPEDPASPFVPEQEQPEKPPEGRQSVTDGQDDDFERF